MASGCDRRDEDRDSRELHLFNVMSAVAEAGLRKIILEGFQLGVTGVEQRRTTDGSRRCELGTRDVFLNLRSHLPVARRDDLL